VTSSSYLLLASHSEGGGTIDKTLLVAYEDTVLENLKPKHLDLVFKKVEAPYSQDHDDIYGRECGSSRCRSTSTRLGWDGTVL